MLFQRNIHLRCKHKTFRDEHQPKVIMHISAGSFEILKNLSKWVNRIHISSCTKLSVQCWRTFAFNHSIFWSTYLTIEVRLVLHHCFKLFKNHLCWSLKANLPYLPVWLMSQSGEILKPQIKVQTPHLVFVNSGVLIFSAIFIQYMLFIEEKKVKRKFFREKGEQALIGLAVILK